MPGFNGTGPMGQGPLTGGGRGYCIVPVGRGSNISYGDYGMQSYPVNASYSYSVMGRPNISPYNYPAYAGRFTGYAGRPGGFFRGGRAGGMFFRRSGIRGRGRR